MNLVLIGYRGCGKSSVGARLAERLGWTFLDTDALLQQRAGRTIRQVFTDEGETGFRRREAAVIAELAARRRLVLSVGGGAVLDHQNVSVLKASGKLVWLAAPAEVLWRRIRQDRSRRATRPPRGDSDTPEALRHLLAAREPIYARVADWTIPVAGRTVDQIARRIEAWARRGGLVAE